MRKPTRVSVVMCTYNGARFIDEQLESIAAQDEAPAELIVRDDASTDDTVDRIHAFAARSPFTVKVASNDTTLGSQANFERALRDAVHDYVLLCDQDDLWAPCKTRVLRESLDGYPESGLVFSNAGLIDEMGVALGSSLWERFGLTSARIDLLCSAQAFGALRSGNAITGATMGFRRAVLLAALPFPAPGATDLIHDGWIALLAAAFGPVMAIDEPLINYRLHGQQQIGIPVGPRGGWGMSGSNRAVADRLKELRDTPDFGHDLAFADLLVERVSYFRSDWARCRRREVEEWHDYLLHRSQLSPRLWNRVPVVLREVRSGRYRRYADSVASSIAKDLFFLHR